MKRGRRKIRVNATNLAASGSIENSMNCIKYKLKKKRVIKENNNVHVYSVSSFLNEKINCSFAVIVSVNETNNE